MKKFTAMLLLAAAASFTTAACDSGGGAGDADATDTPREDGSVDDNGYPAGMPNVTGTWTGCPDLPAPGDNVTVKLVVEDFSEGYPVENVYADIFLGNVVTGTPDFALGPTDADGKTGTFQAPANAQIAYRVNASTQIPEPIGEIKASIEYDNRVPAEGGDIDAISVARDTYMLIQTVLGIPPTPGLGILAGAFTDCAGTDTVGIVARLYPQGSTTPCKDEDGARCMDRYFVNETPARDQKWSSADGLYGIVEIPPADGYTLQIHGKVAGSACPEGLEILGEKTEVSILPDAISIVDVDANAAADHRCVF
jgi:predicted small secreted protein